jgi:hypothetical protein
MEKQFRNHEEFLDELKNVEEHTEWTLVTLGDIEFAEDKDVPGTNLMFRTSCYDQPIRECAMNTLYQRYGLGGSILERLHPADTAELLNFAVKHAPEGMAQVPVVYDMANAFLSAKYVPYSQYKLFRKVKQAIQVSTFSGYWSFESTGGNYLLDKKVTVKDMVGQEKEYDVVLNVRTSEIGESSVAFRCGIRQDGVTVPIMSDVNIIHMGSDVEKDIERTISGLDTIIDHNMRRFNNLMFIDIENNPVAVMKRAAKWARLPKRDTLEAAAQFVPGTFTSAFDVYLALSKVLEKQVTWTGQLRVGGDLAKLINANWKAFDVPGDFAW